MNCGCASRRQFLKNLAGRFFDWVFPPPLAFSVANNAPLKSAQGAWIKSTEGARATEQAGAPGLLWFDADVSNIEINFTGDYTSNDPFGTPEEDVNFDSFLECYNAAGDVIAKYTNYTFKAHDTFPRFATAFPHGIIELDNGRSRYNWNFHAPSGSFIDDPIEEITRVVVKLTSGATVIDSQPNWDFWSLYAGSSRTTRGTTTPWCFDGPFENSTFCSATGENQKLTARWRKYFDGVDTWKVTMVFGTVQAMRPFSGACALTSPADFVFVDQNGDDQTINTSINSQTVTNSANDTAHRLCSSGRWPTSFPSGDWNITWLRNGSFVDLPAGKEPITLKSLSTWGFDDINVGVSTLPPILDAADLI